MKKKIEGWYYLLIILNNIPKRASSVLCLRKLKSSNSIVITLFCNTHTSHALVHVTYLFPFLYLNSKFWFFLIYSHTYCFLVFPHWILSWIYIWINITLVIIYIKYEFVRDPKISFDYLCFSDKQSLQLSQYTCSKCVQTNTCTQCLRSLKFSSPVVTFGHFYPPCHSDLNEMHLKYWAILELCWVTFQASLQDLKWFASPPTLKYKLFKNKYAL